MTAYARKVVGTWLLIGVVMVFVQVILGGITRLTESGLSITEWKPLYGTIPPLNEQQWTQEFDLYKQKVQYQVINEGMTLSEFKWIFFWEYFHRLWARLIGVVFAIPFVYFIIKKYFDKTLVTPLVILFLLGGLQGFIGWIMVKGGLDSLFVPPLRLTTHLVLAFILFSYLIWMTLLVYRGPNTWVSGTNPQYKTARTWSVVLLGLVFLQLFLGGVVSGMKAGLAYPTWPDMNGQFIPSALFTEKATLEGFKTYLPQDFWGRTFIQFVHRLTAYLLVAVVAFFFFRTRKLTNDKVLKAGLNFLPIMILIQATLGIITVLNCVGKIPVSWGMLHQGGAMVLLATVVFITFHLYTPAQPNE